MSALTRDERSKAWELRGAWASRKPVVLSERCMIRRLEGAVQRVAVTGAFVVINDWHVPTDEILAIHSPHFTQAAAA